MIPKKPAPDLIRGGYRFSEKIMLQYKKHDPEKACPGLDPGWVPVSRLREALARAVIWLDASAGEGRSEKIMLQ
jgi:hypothetical protein